MTPQTGAMSLYRVLTILDRVLRAAIIVALPVFLVYAFQYLYGRVL
jgi:hypothetical protein